jgi:hypothetical protein
VLRRGPGVGRAQVRHRGLRPELEELTGFDEGPMREDWAAQFEQRGIAITSDVLRAEAVEVFRAYGERTDAVVHDARGAG